MNNEADCIKDSLKDEVDRCLERHTSGLSAWLYGGETNGTFFGVDRTIKAIINEGKPTPLPRPWHEDNSLNYKYKMLVDIACQLILENKGMSVTELIDKLDSDVYNRSISNECKLKSTSDDKVTAGWSNTFDNVKSEKTATVQSSMKILKKLYPDTGFLRQPNADAYEGRMAYTHQPPADELIKCTGKLSDKKDSDFRYAVIYEDSNAPKNTIYNVKLSGWGYDSMEIEGKDGPTKVVSSKPEPQPNRSCAVCTKCNQMNEYAEPTPNYVCYACR